MIELGSCSPRSAAGIATHMASSNTLTRALATALAALAPSGAHAQQTISFDECVALHEETQRLRQDSRLLEARRKLRQCTNPQCPGLVRTDCLRWVEEVQRNLPSVIFGASADGNDVVRLRILEGEALLAEAVTGRPLELDPGPHTFRAELPGYPPLEATYVLRVGEKNRLVHFDFSRPSPAPVRAPAPAPAPRRPIPVLTYAFGAAALAAAAGGTVLGVMAIDERRSAEERCSPLCTDEELGSVRNLALYSDLSFGAAVVAAGFATYFYLTRPTSEASPVRAAAIASPGFVGAAVGGPF